MVTAASYHGIRKRQTLRAVPIDYVEDFAAETDLLNTGQPVACNDGEANIWKQELEQKVDVLLSELPSRCREIYLLSRRDNLTIAEIAERLSISKRTVENQLTNALKHLRTSLKYAVLFFVLMNG